MEKNPTFSLFPPFEAGFQTFSIFFQKYPQARLLCLVGSGQPKFGQIEQENPVEEGRLAFFLKFRLR